MSYSDVGLDPKGNVFKGGLRVVTPEPPVNPIEGSDDWGTNSSGWNSYRTYNEKMKTWNNWKNLK